MTALVDRWNQFWFEPVPTSTLALFRVAYGLVVFLWTLSIAPDALTFYGSDGLVPDHDLSSGEIGVLNTFTDDWVVVVAIGALLVASAATMLGYHARVATIVVFVVLLSLRRRNPWIVNAGDGLLRHMGLFLMLAPSSAAFSLDRWRTARHRFWESPLRAPWALRLIQIQVSVLYLFTVWEKAKGDAWNEGTAVVTSLRVDDLTRFDVPYGWSESLLLGNVLAYGTLAIELALAVLIWNRRARPWVIAAGVALHLFIELSFSLGFFSLVIFVSYVSFVPEDAGDRFLRRVRGRLESSGSMRARRLAAPPPPVEATAGTS